MASSVIGIDLGGTNMQAAIVDASWRIIGRAHRRTQPEDGQDAVLARIEQCVREACDEAGVSLPDVASVGIGAPAPVDREAGRVLHAPNLGWTDVPLAWLLRERLDRPVQIDNDVRVATLGEHRLGAGRGCDDLIGIWLGTGIGGGLILGGRLHSGPAFTGGEIGQTLLFPGAPAGMRSFEDFCSRAAVVQRFQDSIRIGEVSEMKPDGADEAAAEDLAKALARGDASADRIVNDAANLIGYAAANAVTLLGLGRVVLGGGLSEALGDALVARVRESIQRHAFYKTCREVDVRLTELTSTAGLMGAAILARDAAPRSGAAT